MALPAAGAWAAAPPPAGAGGGAGVGGQPQREGCEVGEIAAISYILEQINRVHVMLAQEDAGEGVKAGGERGLGSPGSPASDEGKGPLIERLVPLLNDEKISASMVSTLVDVVGTYVNQGGGETWMASAKAKVAMALAFAHASPPRESLEVAAGLQCETEPEASEVARLREARDVAEQQLAELKDRQSRREESWEEEEKMLQERAANSEAKLQKALAEKAQAERDAQGHSEELEKCRHQLSSLRALHEADQEQERAAVAEAARLREHLLHAEEELASIRRAERDAAEPRGIAAGSEGQQSVEGPQETDDFEAASTAELGGPLPETRPEVLTARMIRAERREQALCEAVRSVAQRKPFRHGLVKVLSEDGRLCLGELAIALRELEMKVAGGGSSSAGGAHS